MNAVLEEKEIYEYADLPIHEEYEDAPDDEVMRISDRLIEKHFEAYKALANA